MYSKIKQFLDAVPRALTSANEIYNFARNKYKQIMGVFPDGLDDVFLKRGAAEMQDARKKVIKFPEGGKDKTDFFSTRPDPRVKQPKGAKMDVIRANENIAGGSGYAKGDTKFNADVLADEIALMRGANREDLPVDDQIKLYGEAYDYLTEFNRLNNPSARGEFGITVLDDAGKPVKTTTGESPESLMNKLVEMTNQNLKDRGLGSIKLGDKIPPPKNKKPAVDPKLQKSEDQKQLFMDFEDRIETEAQMLERMNRQNKEAVQRLKNKKEKDLADKLKNLPDDIDPDAMADGGRIGFSKGSTGVGVAGNQTEPSQMQGPPVATGIMATPEGMTAEEFARANPTRQQILNPQGPAPQPPIRMQGPQMGGVNFLVPMDVGKKFPTSGGLNELRKLFGFFGAQDMGVGVDIPTSTGMITPAVSPRTGDVQVTARGRFKDGSKPKDPSRRTFIKGIAGLAALPFVGKFLKPAAKVAETAGPAIAEGVKLGYDKFLMLVDKIKRLGRKTDAVTQKEREVGYTYQGKDGSEYELVEDLATGDVRITKDRPGIAVANRGMDDVEGIDVIDDRSTFVLRKGEDVVDPKKKKVTKTQDEYDEMRELPDQDGTFTDIDEVSDNTVNEILEELGETRIKKASGGLAYMLGE